MLSGDLGLTSGRLRQGAENLCHGVEPDSVIFCSWTFGSRFCQTRCRLFTRIYKCFQKDSVKMVLTCLRKGSLVHWPCIMGFQWGKVTRRRVFLGSLLAEWAVFFGQKAHAQVNTHNSHSLLICHSNTHTAALILLMTIVVLLLAVHLSVLHVWRFKNRLHLFKSNVFSVIRMTHKLT